MPITIPSHPLLVIGNIIDPELFDKFNAISEHTLSINEVEERLNSLISTYRSFEFTINEIEGLGTDIDLESIKTTNLKELLKKIKETTDEYIKIKVEKENQIGQIKSNTKIKINNIESPIDYTDTKATYLPYSSDTIKLDCQYFTSDSNDQAQNIQKFVKGSTEKMGNEASKNISEAVSQQVHTQHQNHNISGTIIITATCTHRNIMILDPFIINVDKAVKAWNALYPDDQIDTNNASVLLNIARNPNEKDKKMSILSGATYGSCFVGMIHLLEKNTEKVEALDPDSFTNLQQAIETEQLIANLSGNIEIGSNIKDKLKSLLSSQSLEIHFNVMSMGVFPSISSKEMGANIKKFSNLDSTRLSLTENKEIDSQTTTKTAVKDTQTINEKVSIHKTMTENIILSLDKIDREKNKTFNINTMMTAFDNYINKISETTKESIGIPISYFVRSITKAEIAKMWLKKYVMKEESNKDN